MRLYRHQIWAGLCLALYLLFVAWYGGAGRPMTVQEGEDLIAQIRAASAASPVRFSHPEFAANVRNLVAHDDGREFFMINLETHNHTPEGDAADAAYSAAVIPALLKRGSFPIYAGTPMGNLLGQIPAGIDRVAIVRYRSLRDLLLMNTDPAVVHNVPNKFQSLLSTAAFPTAPFFTALTVRLCVGQIMLVAGLIGWLALRPAATLRTASQPQDHAHAA